MLGDEVKHGGLLISFTGAQIEGQEDNARVIGSEM